MASLLFSGGSTSCIFCHTPLTPSTPLCSLVLLASWLSQEVELLQDVLGVSVNPKSTQVCLLDNLRRGEAVVGLVTHRLILVIRVVLPGKEVKVGHHALLGVDQHLLGQGGLTCPRFLLPAPSVIRHSPCCLGSVGQILVRLILLVSLEAK